MPLTYQSYHQESHFTKKKLKKKKDWEPSNTEKSTSVNSYYYNVHVKIVIIIMYMCTYMVKINTNHIPGRS